MNTDANTQMKDIKKEGEKSLKSAGEAVGNELQNVADKTRHKAREAAHHASRMEDEAIDYVKDKPYVALGIAAGVGVIAGCLLSRR